jgi:DNA-binding response OmpR family regulator
MQVIIASRDVEERDHLAFVLRHGGFSILHLSSLDGQGKRWQADNVDLVILVSQSPDQDLVHIETLRSSSPVPIIVLSEERQEQQLVAFLTAGADLILKLPVGPRLFEAYCRTVLRRSGALPAFGLSNLDLGKISIDSSTRTVRSFNNPAIRLTRLEFRLLYLLITHRGQVIPTEAIIERVWGYSETGSKELVRGLISRLRAKIEPEPAHPQIIHTLSGLGYKFDLN